MRIVSLELIDFVYFKLERVKRFSVNFVNNLQIILGSNGSGKSKLMRELIFLVSPLDSFYPDGSKTIVIEHNGSTYKLITKNSKKEAHSFIKDDVELNDGHTATVQKELVQKEFGLTPRIQNILSRSSSFCKLSGSEMLDLLIEISGIDFKYTDAILAKMGDEKKIAQAQIKFIERSLNDIYDELSSLRFSNKVADPDYLNALNTLSENLNGVMHPEVSEPVEPVIPQHIKEIMKSSVEAIKVLSAFNSVDDVELAVLELDKKIAVMENTYKLSLEAYFNVEQLERETALWGGKDEIIEKIKKNAAKLIDFTDGATEEHLYEEIQKARRVIDAIQEIRACLLELDRPPEQIEANDAARRLKEINAEMASLCRIQDELIDKLNIANDGSFICKNCGKNSEVDEEEKCSSEKRLSGIKERLAALCKEQSALEHVVNTYRSYMKHSQQFYSSIHSSYHWVDIFRLRDPNNTIHLEIEDTIKGHVKTINQIKAKKENEVLGEILKRHATVYDDENVESAAHLHEYLSNLNILRNEKQTLSNALKAYRDANAVLKANVSAIEKFKTALMKKADIDFLNSQAKIRREITKELGAIYSAESRIKTIEEQIKTYEKEKGVRIEKIENINMLLQVLSKREGVAASNLKIFMGEFFAAVNRYVSQIMKSDVAICFDEDVDKLSFKFPVVVNGEKAGDLTTASTGQKDAIDTAVMLVVLECLDFKGYPIFLDEVGSTFDNANRDSLIRFISEMANGQDVSQVFLISHFSSMYSNLANCDITVIHEDNLVDLPLGFNTNVIKE